MLSKYRNENLIEFVLVLLPFGLILMNIKLFNIGESAFKPIHLIVLLIVIFGLIKGISRRKFVLFIIYAFIPLVALFNVVSLSSFVSTYLIYLLSLMLIFIGLPHILMVNTRIISKILITMFRAFNITAIYGILQFILVNFFGNSSLYNNLGKFQFHPHYYNRIFGIDRATSIYIEPSVFAWISITILVLALYLIDTDVLKKKEFHLTIILSTLSVMVSLSASGFVSFIVLFLVYILVTRRVFLRFTVFFIVPMLIILQPRLFGYLRLGEITRPGTSGYARITEPFFTMIEAVSRYPISGRGLGQIDIFDPNLTNNLYIHNSMYGMIITFGVLSLLYIVPISIHFFKTLKSDRMTILFFVNLIMILLTTGSFLSLELPLIVCLYWISIEYKCRYEYIILKKDQ